MPSPHRIAVVRVPDDALTAALTARAPRGSHRVFRDLADDLQALLAFAPDPPGKEGVFSPVEVKAQGGKLKTRAPRGYYP